MEQLAVTFDDAGFLYEGDNGGYPLWSRAPWDDLLGLFHFALPPDIEADLNDLDGLRAFYRQSTLQAGQGVLEIATVVVDGCTAVRTLFKAAQQPTGRIYIGSLTFPFRDFSYILKIQCRELGMTGVRDSSVWLKLSDLGETSIDANRRMSGWLDDPYDPLEKGSMTRNKSERPEYDAEFPDHPLSRARHILNHLECTVRISEVIKQQPPFNWRH